MKTITGTTWKRFAGLFMAGAGLVCFAAGCCTPQRWTEGDPQQPTPLPTPVVLERIEIGIGTTLTAEALATTMNAEGAGNTTGAAGQ